MTLGSSQVTVGAASAAMAWLEPHASLDLVSRHKPLLQVVPRDAAEVQALAPALVRRT